MKTILTFCILALSTALVSAQVSVDIKVDRSQYLAHEPVTAVVTITNRSGRALSFVSKAEGSIAHSWLDFSMRDSGGRGMQKRNNKVFQKAMIPAGRSMARRVNLSSMFNVSRVSNYAVTAHVSQPGLDDTTYTSNSGHLTVGGGNTIYSQPFGVPKSRSSKREYNVITFNDGSKTSIYAQVMDSTTGYALSTFRLSEYLSFVAPQTALDGKNQLHILYLANPEIFVHATVNQDGAHTGTKYFKRVGGRQPRFVPFADGEVAVSGAVPYDPKKEAEKAPTARRASERPK
ncbi:MAG: hypothetical protein ACJAQT_002988 [Akkermansiaceae bacterium]|jgi:hypothetical protein